jgi:hypothetical protein
MLLRIEKNPALSLSTRKNSFRSYTKTFHERSKVNGVQINTSNLTLQLILEAARLQSSPQLDGSPPKKLFAYSEQG